MRLFQGETAPHPQGVTHRQRVQQSLSSAQLWGCTGSITQGEAQSDRATPEQLHSTILPHSQDQTNSPAFPQALPHTKVGTDLLGPIFWQNHVPQDNSDYTPNTTFTAPSHHTPHPAPFCLRTTYGGDGHETSPTATEARDQVAPRAEHKARTHHKCGLKCLIRGFAGLGFFPSPHQPMSKRTEFTYQNCLFVGKS